MNCRGTAPPTTLSTNSKPPPEGSGSTSMSHTAYWPWPPDCLTWRPCPLALAGERLAQRDPQRHRARRRRRTGCAAGRAARRRGPRPCTTARAGGSRRCSPAAASGPRRRAGRCPGASLSSSALDLRDDGDRQQRVGHQPRLHQQRLLLVRQRVAGLGAGQLGDRADVAGDALRDGALGLAQRRGEGADPLVDVVVLVAAVGQEVARHVHGRSRAAACRRRPGPGRSARRTGRWWS